MKFVFVSSLERSGSTILDLSLAQYPNVISLGEVWRTIRPHGACLDSVLSRECSCGKKGGDCPFWSAVLASVSALGPEASLSECYSALADAILEHYGNEVILVDSSKSLQALDAIRQVQGFDVHVIHTVRDVRGWMNSIRKAEKRKKELPWGKIFEPGFGMFWLSYLRHNLLRKIPLWLANEWILRNLRLEHAIAKSGFKRLDISYEAMVFSNRKTMAAIENYLGINPSLHKDRHDLRPQIHIIRGNRTAFQSISGDALRYDSTWMRKLRYCVMLIIMPWVMAFNQKKVYSHLDQDKDGTW